MSLPKYNYLVIMPHGMEELFVEELREKSQTDNDEEVLWIGVGAVQIKTRALPSHLIKLRSIDFLCAHLHHSVVDIPKFELSGINGVIDPLENPEFKSDWEAAFDLWHQCHPQHAHPLKADLEKNIVKYRVSAQRRGPKGKFTSMEAAARLGEVVHENFPGLTTNLKDFDLELFLDVNCNQLFMGITLTADRVSIRNRKELVATTLDAANAYALLKWAKIQPGEIVMDPMAGSGTIPIEGSQLYPHSHFIISDHSWRDTLRANVNANTFGGPGGLGVICAEIGAIKLPLRPQIVDCIISDLPFGRRHGSVSANKALYPALFKQMERCLRSGGRALLLTLAKTVIKTVIKDRERLGWTLVSERVLEVGGYLSCVYELSYTFQPEACGANRNLVHYMTGKPRVKGSKNVNTEQTNDE